MYLFVHVKEETARLKVSTAFLCTFTRLQHSTDSCASAWTENKIFSRLFHFPDIGKTLLGARELCLYRIILISPQLFWYANRARCSRGTQENRSAAILKFKRGYFLSFRSLSRLLFFTKVLKCLSLLLTCRIILMTGKVN